MVDFNPEIINETDSKDNHNIIDQTTQRNESQEIFDVAIIGAGFSGLSAALLLGRYLRKTVVFDNGNTRNHTSRYIHGYLGFENSSPQEFLQKAWKDVLQDSKPNIENFEIFDGNGAWHCPHCDGFQTTNKKLGIITYGKNTISYAKEFLGWTRDITVFVQGNYQLTDIDRNDAKTLGIKLVENDDIIRISGNTNRCVEKIVCERSGSYEIDVIFYYLGYKVQNELAKQIGCELDGEEGFIKVNSSQQTTVRNVYAVGDVDTDRHYVVFAAASGAVAAISIYEQLLKDAIRNTKEKS